MTSGTAPKQRSHSVPPGASPWTWQPLSRWPPSVARVPSPHLRVPTVSGAAPGVPNGGVGVGQPHVPAWDAKPIGNAAEHVVSHHPATMDDRRNLGLGLSGQGGDVLLAVPRPVQHFFHAAAAPEIYTLSLHDALPLPVGTR